MTLFNIRLGLWLHNPDRYGNIAVPARDGEGPGEKQRNEKRIFWPRYMLKELAAFADARSHLVNLSDGGHTGDNIGLYPLLQRRCKLIIVCDGECDPDYTFSSLVSAIRQIYTDENVYVDVDLNKIRPRKKGKRPKSHFTVGRIRYPDCREDHPDSPDAKNRWGWIIYLKSSLLLRDEPGLVKGYAARYDEFPHQTTADQFFDDEQFEAYRALGSHIAKAMLDDAGLSDLKRGNSAGNDAGNNDGNDDGNNDGDNDGNDDGDWILPTAKQLITWCERCYQKQSEKKSARKKAGEAEKPARVATPQPVAKPGMDGDREPTREEIVAALKTSNNIMTRAAAALNMSTAKLKTRMKRHNITLEKR